MSLRIIGGLLGGRPLRVPGKGVRPTQEKVRAALFSSLAARIPGARVLDLFAGSGALGIEAWSRGAAHVCAVESDRAAYAVLKQNIADLCHGEEGIPQSVSMDVFAYLRRDPPPDPYDLVLADPPYDRAGSGRRFPELISLLSAKSWVAPSGILVYEQGADEAVVEVPGWVSVRDRKYGDTRLLTYVRAS